jgi:hypothetical protein
MMAGANAEVPTPNAISMLGFLTVAISANNNPLESCASVGIGPKSVKTPTRASSIVSSESTAAHKPALSMKCVKDARVRDQRDVDF